MRAIPCRLPRRVRRLSPLAWRRGRLGRLMSHLVKPIEAQRHRSVGFRSVSDGVIDTTGASGKRIFPLCSFPAPFERRLIQGGRM
jgi:DNA invertase Pin-like site-specific DNA recombinase